MSDPRKLVKKLSYVLYVVVIVLLIGLILVGGSVLVMKLIGGMGSEEFDDFEPETYRYYTMNKQTKESDSGLLTIFTQLDEEGYLFSEEEESYTLISNFGTTEYQCTGSCSCEEGNNGRRNSLVIGRGLIYLAAAFTSIVAFEAAKEYFDEKCKEEFQDSCALNSIESKVDDCEQISKEVKTEESQAPSTTPEEGKKEEAEPPEKTKIQEYECFGRCIKNDPKREIHEQNSQPNTLAYIRKEFKMTQKKFDKRTGGCVTLTLNELKTVEIKESEYDPKEDYTSRAVVGFLFGDLNTFCQENSREMFIKDDNDKPLDAPMCIGYNSQALKVKAKKEKGLGNMRKLNPSVRCVLKKTEV